MEDDGRGTGKPHPEPGSYPEPSPLELAHIEALYRKADAMTAGGVDADTDIGGAGEWDVGEWDMPYGLPPPTGTFAGKALETRSLLEDAEAFLLNPLTRAAALPRLREALRTLADEVGGKEVGGE